MRKAGSVLSAAAVAGAVVLGGAASAVGDATYTLASHRAMAIAALSPSERIMAVYMASAERLAMLDRLRKTYPWLLP